MICENCELDYEINCVGRYLITNDLGETFFDIRNNYLSSGRTLCESCGSILNSKEYFYENEDDLFADLGNAIAKTFSDLVMYDGSDEDNLSSNIYNYFDEQDDHPERLQNMVGSPETIGEVIEERLSFVSDISEYIKPAILSYLNEVVFNNEEHDYLADLDTNVVTKESRDFTDRKFYGIDTSKVESELDALISYIYTIDDEELNKLQDDETNDIYLDCNEVYKNLREEFIKLKQKGYGVTIDTKKFYRARIMEDKDFKELKIVNKNKLKSKALTPPIGVSSQGRWNVGGKPTTLYVSDEYSYLPEEVNYSKKKSMKKLVIFELETSKSRLLIPISLLAHSSKLYSRLSKKINKAENSREYKQEYVLSNLIGKIIRNSGYSGIIYDPTFSSLNDNIYNGLPMNYAIFNPNVNNLDCFDDVRVNGFFEM